jgi:raffinose/stachyose/melibiose transport system substrate-binding protein
VANAYLSGVEGVISGSKSSKDVMTGVQQAAAKAKKQAG